MLSRLARWWLARSERRAAKRAPIREVECTTCAVLVPQLEAHVIVALSDDDHVLGIEGQTAMSADFCPDHCPGGCLRGCVPSTT